jgi:hypothetical protein
MGRDRLAPSGANKRASGQGSGSLPIPLVIPPLVIPSEARNPLLMACFTRVLEADPSLRFGMTG